MSSTSLMGLGKQAASAAYAQLQTTGNNIANANTPGYSRQSVNLAASAGSAYSGSGYFGQGVTVTSVTRASNLFLSSQAVAATAAASADGARNALVGQLERVFVGGSAGLGGAATQIFNAYADLAAAPADLSARQAVLGRLQDFASLARSASAQIEVLQANVNSDVRGAVDTVNSLASQLALLNVSIASANNSGQPPNDLLDQRDLLIKKIGEQIEVQTVVGPDQSVSVFIGSGQNLVQGNSAHALVASADAADPTRVAVGLRIAGAVTLLGSEAIGGGQIGGLLKFQETDLVDARNRIGQLVIGLAGALNDQQALGLDLQRNAGAALFSFAGPQVLPNTNNARDGAGNFVAAPSITVSDPSALKASDYRLQSDPANAGQYIVTRLSDGWVFPSVADKGVVRNSDTDTEGFALNIGANALAPGDSFVIKPVSASAGSLTVMMINPAGPAAANPVTAVMAQANTGNASISAVDIVAKPDSGSYAQLTLSFTDNDGNYKIRDAAGSEVDGKFAAGEPISYDGIAISLSGLPREGDSIVIEPTRNAASSNGNALRFDSMASRILIGGQTVGDAYASAIAEVGVRAQSAALAASNSATVSAQADASLGGAVGVNLDEEAARLLQFQQAYQAAAKVMQSAQQMFDAILAILR